MSSFGLTTFMESVTSPRAPPSVKPVPPAAPPLPDASSSSSSSMSPLSTNSSSLATAAAAGSRRPPKRSSLLRAEGVLARAEAAAMRGVSDGVPSACLLEDLGDAYWNRVVGHRADNVQRALLSFRFALRLCGGGWRDGATQDDDDDGCGRRDKRGLEDRGGDDDDDGVTGGNGNRLRERARLNVKVARGVLETLRLADDFCVDGFGNPDGDRHDADEHDVDDGTECDVDGSDATSPMSVAVGGERGIRRRRIDGAFDDVRFVPFDRGAGGGGGGGGGCGRFGGGVGVGVGSEGDRLGDVGRRCVDDAVAFVDAGLAMYTRNPGWIDDMRDARVYLTGWVCRGLLYEIAYRDVVDRSVDAHAVEKIGSRTSDEAEDACENAVVDVHGDVTVADGGKEVAVDGDEVVLDGDGDGDMDGDGDGDVDGEKMRVKMASHLDECIRSLEVAIAAGGADGSERGGKSGVQQARSVDGNVISRCHARLLGIERARTSVALARAYCAMVDDRPRAVDRARRMIRGIGSLLAGLVEGEEAREAWDGVFVSGDGIEIAQLKRDVDVLTEVLKGSGAVPASRCVLS